MGIAIIASPIIFALVVYPDSFSLSWNQGRGGFLFALAFVGAELIGLRLGISQRKLFAVIPLALLTIIYLVGLENGLRDYILESAEKYNVQLIYSWTWMWDFIIMSIFVIASVTIYFGKQWIRISRSYISGR